MATPKHKIFFGPAILLDPDQVDLPPIEFPPPEETPVPPDDMNPPGWLWDSELVELSTQSRTMDEGYTEEQLLYLLLNEL